jgi:hypothetical protein
MTVKLKVWGSDELGRGIGIISDILNSEMSPKVIRKINERILLEGFTDVSLEEIINKVKTLKNNLDKTLGKQNDTEGTLLSVTDYYQIFIVYDEMVDLATDSNYESLTNMTGYTKEEIITVGIKFMAWMYAIMSQTRSY